jgi:ethanolamine permease
MWGLVTLIITGLGVLFLNTGVDGGAASIGTSATPLFDGFKGVFGEGTAAELLPLIGLVGLIASFFTIIYAYGPNTYSLSRAGYFPKWLSVTHGSRNTPHRALIAGAIVGYGLAVLIYELGQGEGALAGQIVGALLYMAVFGAVISYFMQCLSFILLRRRSPDIERPYRSPVGEWGAAVAGVIALVSLISLYSNSDYRPGVYGTLVYVVLGIAYFAVAGRNRLVLSPEEESAMTRGEHGHPEREGYGTTRVIDIDAETTTPKETPPSEPAKGPRAPLDAGHRGHAVQGGEPGRDLADQLDGQGRGSGSRREVSQAPATTRAVPATAAGATCSSSRSTPRTMATTGMK